MADEFVGRRVQPFGDAGVEGDLAHEDEERDDREAVGGQNIEEVLGQQVQAGLPGDDVTEPQEPHQSHGEPEFDARQKEQKDRTQTDQSGRNITHSSP